jgi:oxygen-independent coproporphyrinogen-3 oxidase
MKSKDDMILALAKELQMRKYEISNEEVETIYFGGGTPSVLSVAEIDFLIDNVYRNYKVAGNAEITLEANPDDLSPNKIKELHQSPINRLSIGIQSFFDDDLRMMNRAHNADQAKDSLTMAAQYFDNISIDLIYGIPGMSDVQWLQNIDTALSYNIPHISSYALTVEPKTALKKLIATGAIASPNDDDAQQHFHLLVDKLSKEGFIHYELSNFAKEKYLSRNNSAYWLGKKYIGIGPSAHSYDGSSRSWNIANNNLYLKSIEANVLPSEVESLTLTDRYNEYIMTGLRTIWGISLHRILQDFGVDYVNYLQKQAVKYLDDHLLKVENDIMTTTNKGKFLADGIASDLFFINE